MTESLGCVWWGQGRLPIVRPYEGAKGNNLIEAGREIAPGAQALTVVFSSQQQLGPEADDIWQGGADWHLYVMGWIDYVGELPGTQRMAFCRVYDARERRFVRVDDPDYEHGEE